MAIALTTYGYGTNNIWTYLTKEVAQRISIWRNKINNTYFALYIFSNLVFH